MATSGTYTYSKTAYTVIKRGLRIANAYSQGEAPSQLSITDALEVLNDLTKEWQTDGMALWRVQNVTIPLIAGTRTYTIGNNASYSVNTTPPLKMINAYLLNIVASPNTRIPLITVTRSDYELLSDFLTGGQPNQVWYDPPGVLDNATGQLKGSLTTYNVPTAADVTQWQLVITGMMPYEDYTDPTGADSISFPQHWYNALVWGFVDQIALEYGIPSSERTEITKKMLYHKDKASSFDLEEGSMFIQPMSDYSMRSR